MKVKASELKTVNVAYLYEDGHMVLVHRRSDKDAGEVEWVTIYQNVSVKAHFPGRLIIDPGALPFILHATSIEAREASVEGGSENTKKLGVAVGSVIIRNGNDRGFIINLFPDILSSDLTYQPDVSETFDAVKDGFRWGFEHIKAVYAD